MVGRGRWNEQDERSQEEAFLASQCLQCGHCLEICTSYEDGREFYGMQVMVPMVRVLGKSAGGKDLSLLEQYREHIYKSCEGFNACEHVCPMGIPVTELMAHTNSIMKRRLHMEEGITGGELAKGDCT